MFSLDSDRDEGSDLGDLHQFSVSDNRWTELTLLSSGQVGMEGSAWNQSNKAATCPLQV
jgi:hypothetical protein